MEYFKLIMALIGVLALVFVLFWLMKKLNSRVYMSSGRSLKVLERVNIGQDKCLLLISVCGKCMVVGVSPNHTEKLCDLEQTEEEIIGVIENKNGENPSFMESMKTVMGNMFDKKK